MSGDSELIRELKDTERRTGRYSPRCTELLARGPQTPEERAYVAKHFTQHPNLAGPKPDFAKTMQSVAMRERWSELYAQGRSRDDATETVAAEFRRDFEEVWRVCDRMKNKTVNAIVRERREAPPVANGG